MMWVGDPQGHLYDQAFLEQILVEQKKKGQPGAPEAVPEPSR